MCTVTVVPDVDGFRLLCNRDERGSRLEALAPRVAPVGNRRAIFPVDPEGGGTWIGVNDAGVAMAVLNRTDKPGATRAAAGRWSRGLVIPRVLRCGTIDAALEAAARTPWDRFAPFRLFIAVPQRCGIVSSDAGRTVVELRTLDVPLMMTSSSLGDRRVEGPRRRLFEALVLRAPGGWLQGQRTFHRHQWADRSEVSVTMQRADARTVSRTAIHVTSSRVELEYEPLGEPPHPRASVASVVRLDRNRSPRERAA